MIELSIGQATTYSVILLIIGVIVGIMIIALMKAASEEDRRREMKNKDKYNLDQIEFRATDDIMNDQTFISLKSEDGIHLVDFKIQGMSLINPKFATVEMMEIFVQWLEKEVEYDVDTEKME